MTLASRIWRFKTLTKGVAHRVLWARGWEVRRRPPSLLNRPQAQLNLDLEHLIALRLLDSSDLFVVQIGAFDGRTDDQVHEWITRFGWRGILVEPHPRQFAELTRTYAEHPQLTLRNVAISDRHETRTLYALREGVSGLPSWAPQVASFDRAVVDRHGLHGPDGEDIVDTHQVECVPLSDLLADVEHIDLLQVDVEGYDDEIIRMFDFDRRRPSIVRFESRHLSRSEHDGAVERLLEYGYAVALTEADTIGWRRT